MKKKIKYTFLGFSLSFLMIACAYDGDRIIENTVIDRFALVNRNNVVLHHADTLGSLSVGNGEMSFTTDVTGLQSFPEYYQNGIALGTQSQWGWHSFPNPENYTIDDVTVMYETCNDHEYPIAIQHGEGKAGAATHFLRTSPHRLHLGQIGFELLKRDGSKVVMSDVKDIHQELNLWEGKITSKYSIDNTPVMVELFCHQNQDLISFRVTSPLMQESRLKLFLRFPYGSDCHVCPGTDWNAEEKHSSAIITHNQSELHIRRSLDNDAYFTRMTWSGNGSAERMGPHYFVLTPGENKEFQASILFTSTESKNGLPDFEDTEINSKNSWDAFWMNGGAIDFSECTDPRATELERRVILSQYLTKIQCSGTYPPQETGLTMNSWYGKFHLEMHWWHGVHFPLWNRPDLLEKSMWWYQDIIEKATRTASRQGFEGVRWPKMTGPNGQSSPSSVGEFLVWQQPHPIYFAEQLYRLNPSLETLHKYQEMVFRTADFMASFAKLDENDGKYHLCHPLIPAQEIFHATETDDPPFEIAYWYYALNVAQEWRSRLGLPEDKKWDDVVENLTELPEYEGLYLPAAGAKEAYSNDENRRDHPVVTGALGMLPLTSKVNPIVMQNTFEEIMRNWNWQTTWGWDYPMLAMCAARLGKQEMAIDALMLEVQKNTYLVNGHNYQDKRLRLYLPGNGGLLTAVAMMAAGWEGDAGMINPGFPKNGKWKIRWEDLHKMQ